MAAQLDMFAPTQLELLDLPESKPLTLLEAATLAEIIARKITNNTGCMLPDVIRWVTETAPTASPKEAGIIASWAQLIAPF